MDSDQLTDQFWNRSIALGAALRAQAAKPRLKAHRGSLREAQAFIDGKRRQTADRMHESLCWAKTLRRINPLGPHRFSAHLFHQHAIELYQFGLGLNHLIDILDAAQGLAAQPPRTVARRAGQLRRQLQILSATLTQWPHQISSIISDLDQYLRTC